MILAETGPVRHNPWAPLVNIPSPFPACGQADTMFVPNLASVTLLPFCAAAGTCFAKHWKWEWAVRALPSNSRCATTALK